MNTTKFISLLFFQVFFISASGQLSQPQLDSVVKDYTQALQKKRIDTICVYEEYCNGCFFYSEKEIGLCEQKIAFLPTYIFWKEKGKTFMTKKDACFNYSVIKISADSFWHFYSVNRDKLKKEELKKPQYLQIVNGKEKINTIEIDNSIYYRIRLQLAKDFMVKNINNFYFTLELGENLEKNINYDYNMKSLLNGLHSSLQRTIHRELEKKRLIGVLR